MGSVQGSARKRDGVFLPGNFNRNEQKEQGDKSLRRKLELSPAGTCMALAREEGNDRFHLLAQFKHKLLPG